jgi:hypothetical protein
LDFQTEKGKILYIECLSIRFSLKKGAEGALARIGEAQCSLVEIANLFFSKVFRANAPANPELKVSID